METFANGVRKPYAVHVVACVIQEEDGIMVIPKTTVGQLMALVLG